jgi:hypothetical protein
MATRAHRFRAALIAASLLTGCASRSIDIDDETGTETETSAGSGSDHVLVDDEESCDPLEQDCGGGMGCYIGDLDAAFQCELIGWGIAEGLPCTKVNDCLPGLMCLPSELQPDCEGEFACCARFCALEQPVCPPGTACLAYFQDGPPPEYDNVGVCLTP